MKKPIQVHAGLNTFIKRYIAIKENFGEETADRAFITARAYLQTFGLKVRRRRKNYTKYEDEFYDDYRIQLEHIKHLRDKLLLYIDSGGYQVSVGDVHPEGLSSFRDAYVNFLNKYNDTYDRAFSLDAIFGPTENITREYFVNVNLEGLKLVERVNDKGKLLPVFHIISPPFIDIFEKLFFQETNVYTLGKASVGGLVAFGKNKSKSSYISYILTLHFILKKIQELTGDFPKVFEFHVLGVSAYFDMLVYCYFTRLYELEYGVSLQITHDSSKYVRGTVKSKEIIYFDENSVYLTELSYRSKDLQKIVWYDGRAQKQEDLIFNLISDELGVDLPTTNLYVNDKINSALESLIIFATLKQDEKLVSFLTNIFKTIDNPEKLKAVAIYLAKRIFNPKDIIHYVRLLEQTHHLICNTKLTTSDIKNEIKQMFCNNKFCYV